ncbi:MAG: hypothetical protein AAFR61_10230 [Bacteroidota bacterium]
MRNCTGLWLVLLSITFGLTDCGSQVRVSPHSSLPPYKPDFVEPRHEDFCYTVLLPLNTYSNADFNTLKVSFDHPGFLEDFNPENFELLIFTEDAWENKSRNLEHFPSSPSEPQTAPLDVGGKVDYNQLPFVYITFENLGNGLDRSKGAPHQDTVYGWKYRNNFCKQSYMTYFGSKKSRKYIAMGSHFIAAHQGFLGEVKNEMFAPKGSYLGIQSKSDCVVLFILDD